MTTTKTCDICRFARQKVDPVTMQPVSDVLRYTLRREDNQRRENGARSQRYQMSAGGIDLCTECWERVCKPNMNPKKSSRARRAS